jgi:hypothetical protein
MNLVDKIKEWYLTFNIKEGCIVTSKSGETYFISQLTTERVLRRNSPKGYNLIYVARTSFIRNGDGSLTQIYHKAKSKTFWTINNLRNAIIKGHFVYNKKNKLIKEIIIEEC